MDNILISRFFKNLCTEEEAMAVAKYLEANPEKLDEWLPLKLWDEIETPPLSLSEAKKAELLQVITAKARIKHRRPVVIWSLSAAASLLLVLGLAWWMNIDRNDKMTTVKAQNIITPAYTLVKINYGKEDMKLKIVDGSVIYLKPGGEIRYLEKLSKQKRDFILKGIARFKVAEDKTRPFNVFAGGTVTTALGTDFTISSEEKSDNVSVLLHNGKVVVSSDGNINHNGMKKTYLLPGNKLLINKENFHVTLIKNGDQPKLKHSSVIEQKGETVLTATNISFRNQSLDKIFGVLKSDFSADIQFEKVQLKGMYFTGSFKRNAQTVALILNDIALLNHLNIEIRGSTYILKPQTKK